MLALVVLAFVVLAFVVLVLVLVLALVVLALVPPVSISGSVVASAPTVMELIVDPNPESSSSFGWSLAQPTAQTEVLVNTAASNLQRSTRQVSLLLLRMIASFKNLPPRFPRTPQHDEKSHTTTHNNPDGEATSSPPGSLRHLDVTLSSQVPLPVLPLPDSEPEPVPVPLSEPEPDSLPLPVSVPVSGGSQMQR